MKENMIEEKAYLFIDNYEVGVTNNPLDVAKKVKTLPFGATLKLECGPKELMLEKQAVILGCDAVVDAWNQGDVVIPLVQPDYNISKRNPNPEKLREIYSFVRPEQNVEKPRFFGSLIEGGDKHVK